MNIGINDSKETYKAPQSMDISVKIRRTLCLSGNESMCEKDYGDGGFEED